MDFFRILDWDSDFFGMTVAQILPNRLTIEELEQAINVMKMQKVRLAYWASDPHDVVSQNAAQACHGLLADRKITYYTELAQTEYTAAGSDWVVEEYAKTSPNSQLEALAAQAGIYSRFRVDPHIPDDKFFELYRQWILKSVNRQIADAVLVAYRDGLIAGMVTVGIKNGRGDIGLIAVDAQMRGKSLGSALIRAAQNYALKCGLTSAQVITQGDNIAACTLYERCGYRVEKMDYFYHFWM